MRRLPPLNALRSFESAARLGSFIKAADELFVTPSAISHQIKTLESILELNLFIRDKRRVTLTSAGEKYFSAIEHALDEIDSATRRLLANPNVGAVTISVSPAFLTRWLMQRLSHFQAAYPDVELRLSASMEDIDFDHSDIDMGVLFGQGYWPDIESHFLLGMSLEPVCSPALLQGQHLLDSLDDLSHHNLLHISSRPEEWRTWMRAAGLEDRGHGKGLSFSSTSLATGAAVEGLGIALAERHLVAKELATGQLVVPFDITLDTNSAFYLVYGQNRPLTYGMKAFRDWILSEI